MEIQPLTEADAAAFWAVRLRAVREHPEAFGWSFDELRDTPPETVTSNFHSDWVVGGFMLGAFEGGRIVGTLGLRRSQPEKQRHKGTIRPVYVAPEVRGRGVAASLLAEAIRRARELPDLEVLELSVGVTNDRARRLYAAFGFEEYGVEQWALKVGDRYVDEVLMTLRLDQSREGVGRAGRDRAAETGA